LVSPERGRDTAERMEASESDGWMDDFEDGLNATSGVANSKPQIYSEDFLVREL